MSVLTPDVPLAPEMRFEVVHRTEYRYGKPMVDGYTVAHLLPRDTPWQTVETAEVVVEPGYDERSELVDAFGNRVIRLGIHRPHDHLVLTGRCIVRASVPVIDLNQTAGSPPWDEVTALLRSARGDIAVEVGSFVAATGSTPVSAELLELTDDVFVPGRPLLDVVARLSTRIHTALEFDPAFSDVSTPLAEVLRARRGVCQDFAHLMLAALRGHGLAGRYVSGYLETVPPPGQPKLAGTDASHAWCGVWDPVLGWFDVDPTNDQLPPRRHVTCAWGRDYFDVAPVRGVVIGPMAPQTLHVGVDVTARS